MVPLKFTAPATPSVIVALIDEPVTVPVTGPPLKQLVAVSEILTTPVKVPAASTEKLNVTEAVIVACPVGLMLGSVMVSVTDVRVPEYEEAGGKGPALSTLPLLQLARDSARMIVASSLPARARRG
jgi:hypothetical protein